MKRKLNAFGKVLAVFLALIIAFQGIGEFYGLPISSPIYGVELIVIAVIIIVESNYLFQKPKYPYVRYTFVYDDGTSEDRIVSNDEPIAVKIDKEIKSIKIHYFESDKDEVANEHKN